MVVLLFVGDSSIQCLAPEKTAGNDAPFMTAFDLSGLIKQTSHTKGVILLCSFIVMPYNLDQENSRLVVIGAQDSSLHYVGEWQQQVVGGDMVSSTTAILDSVSLQFRG